MQTRRDHVQAYEFASSRLASALVAGDAGLGVAPLRRSSLGVVFGVLAAVLLVAGFAVYGLINPGGNTTWRQTGAIIVEKETGNRYLYVDGRLWPTMNYASALLAGGGEKQVRIVSRDSLAGVPHGAPIGIPGAPDALPGRGALLPGVWSMCLHPGVGSGLTLDLDPDVEPADRSRALVVGADGTKYLIHADTKYRLVSTAVVLALGLGDQVATEAPEVWLNVLPAGPDVGPSSVPGGGDVGPDMADTPSRVGELFQTSSVGGDKFYVMRADGLAPMTRTEAVLMSVLPNAGQPKRMDPSEIAAAPASADDSLLRRLPDLVDVTPSRSDEAALCVRQQVNKDDPNRPRVDIVRQRGAATGTGRVLVPPGRGLIAVATPLPTRPGEHPIRYLVTDQGVKFRIADDSATSALGYAGVPGRPMPDSVLSLLPDGPVLFAAKGRH